MGFMFVMGRCCGCGIMFSFNADYVPSLRVEGKKEPLCRECFNLWNEIHLTRKGKEALPLHPNAYDPEEVP